MAWYANTFASSGIEWQFTFNPFSTTVAGVVALAKSTTGTEYIAVSPSSGSVSYFSAQGATSYNEGTAAGFLGSYTLGQTYVAKVAFTAGNTLKLKVWRLGDTEPAAYGAPLTTSHTLVGMSAGLRGTSLANGAPIAVDDFSIAYNGALLPAIPTPTPSPVASPSPSPSPSAPAYGGLLTETASNAMPAGVTSLTATGQDWRSWVSLTEHDKQKTGTLPDYTEIGTTTTVIRQGFASAGAQYSWTDGTPRAANTNLNGLQRSGGTQGFGFTPTADTTLRTWDLYIAADCTIPILTATINEAGAPTIADTSYSATPPEVYHHYQLSYRAASIGHLLTATITTGPNPLPGPGCPTNTTSSSVVIQAETLH